MNDKSMAGSEIIIATLVDKLNIILERLEEEQNPEQCEVVLELIELGNKLLSDAYYTESKDGVDYLLRYKHPLQGLAVWQSIYKKEYAEKLHDYRRFFKLIANNVEEW